MADAPPGAVLGEVFPTLKKISVDFAVMEPASRDPQVRVVAVPMPLQWLDVGSWPMFAETCQSDGAGNALGVERSLLVDTRGTLVASDVPGHLIATIGCEDLIIVHTAQATLVCRRIVPRRSKSFRSRLASASAAAMSDGIREANHSPRSD